MRISIIAAVAENGVIGRGNELPWHLSADLRRFKRLTMGHHLLLGRKTFEAIGRSLPGRSMVVISRGSPALPPGVRLVASLDAAIDVARLAGDSEAFVAGGGQIYRLALPIADRIYLTRIAGTFAGDTWFPDIDDATWSVVEREDHSVDPDSGLSYSFLILDRNGLDQPAS